jgi:hypothetical protein
MILHSVDNKFTHLNSITHEGKIVIIATDDKGALWYSIKQDGFEDTYLQADPAQRTGWEEWREVPLPGRRKDKSGHWLDEDPDQSVVEKELNNQFLHSRYHTFDQSIVAPVQLVSDLGHLYVFRQSTTGHLLVDRFVLDGMTNELVRKLEVRFKRSGEKYRPLQSTGGSGNTQKLTSIDSMDFRDADDQPFYEPTTELSLLSNLINGWFSVVLVPTNDHDVQRWHFFLYNNYFQSMEIVSIRSSKEGLFDVKDQFVTHPKPATLSGIVRRKLEITDVNKKPLHVANGFSATRYDVQNERQTKKGPQLMREAVRIMLAVPTDDGNTAAIDFAVTSDGSLSRIDETPSGVGHPLVSESHEIMLPLDTLSQLKAIGDSTPPAHGIITGLRRAPTTDRVVVTSSEFVEMKIGDQVQLANTRSYDGSYDTIYGPYDLDNFNGGTVESFAFEVPEKERIGSWEKIEKRPSGMVYDGMITSLQDNGENWLAISSPGSSLSEEDEVQIQGTEPANGVYRVSSVSDYEFTVERKWQPGTVIDLKQEANKRLGVEFNDNAAYIDIPNLELGSPYPEQSKNELNGNLKNNSSSGLGNSLGKTYSAWVYLRKDAAGYRKLLVQNDGSIEFSLIDGAFNAAICMSGEQFYLRDPNPAMPDCWTHYAATIHSQCDAEGAIETQIQLYRNGGRVADSGVLYGIPVPGNDAPWSLAQKLRLDHRPVNESFASSSLAINDDEAIFSVNQSATDPESVNCAYVIQRQVGEWKEMQCLKGRGAFGKAVAIEDDIALVRGDGHSLHIYEKVGNKWIESEHLDVDALLEDEPGQSGSNYYGYSSSSLAINGGNLIASSGGGNGSAYIRWGYGEEAKYEFLYASDGADGDYFGAAVDIDGSLAVVSAVYADGAAGAVYLFEFDGDSWVQIQKIQADDKAAGDCFGGQLALSGNRLFVSATGHNLSQGAVYVFERNEEDNQWFQSEKIEAENGASGEHFGDSIDLVGETALITKTVSGETQCSVYQYLDGYWGETRQLTVDRTASRLNNDKLNGDVVLDGDGVLAAALLNHAFSARTASLCTFQAERQSSFSVAGSKGENTEIPCPIKMADLQIWNCARSANDIKNSMYLTLTGKEANLAGYWRMGAIVPGEPRTVVDFSLQQNHAIVHGDAFVSAKTLKRHLKATDEDGNPITATQFINDDYFAVSQRASYVETFEFRVDDADDDAEKPSDDLFQFSYWGKRSRGADTELPDSVADAQDKFAAMPELPFEGLGGGWYKATCRFTVPDDINLVRSFGIADVTGDWAELHIRKHQVSHITNCITEESYTDKVSLELLAGEQEARKSVIELDHLEKQEGVWLRDKRHLEMVLCDTRWDELIAAKQAEVNAQQGLVNTAWRTYRYWTTELQRMLLSVDLFVDSWYRGGKANYSLGRHSFDCNWWNDEVTSLRVPYGLKITLYQHASYNGTQWVLNSDNPNVGWFNDELSSFEISTLAGNTNHLNIALSHRKSFTEHFGHNAWLTLRRQQLAKLKADRNADRGELNRRLTKVKTELAALSNQFAPVYSVVLKAVADSRQHIQKMPKLHRDKNGLATTGASLGFARPASRISVIETCEGNVQLSYFDHSGYMRQARYDATADSRNGQFEEWLADDLRSCIHFNRSTGSISLNDKEHIAPNKEWSIEAWVCLPLADADDQGGDRHPTYWRSLATSANGEDGYLVARYQPKDDTEMLGIRVNGQFKSSDCDLTHLPDGWHHLSATAKNGATRFYIDGHIVGAYPGLDKLNALKTLEQESKPKAVKLADLKEELETARSQQDNGEHTRSKSEKQHQELLENQISELEKITDVKTQSNAIKAARAAAKAIQPSEPITAIASSVGSDSKPFGKVAELRIWNIGLSDDEIAANSKTLLSGNEPGLLAYYPMDEAGGSEIRDQSGNGHTLTHSSPVWWGCSAPIGQVMEARNSSVKFDGNNSLGATDIDEPEDGFFTAEVWLRPETPVSDISMIFELFGGLFLYRENDNQFELDFTGIDEKIPVHKDAWFHLAISTGYIDGYVLDEDSDEDPTGLADAQCIKVYIDGIEVGSGPLPDLDTTISDMGIGCFAHSLSSGSNEGDGYNGQMSELRIWDGKRSAEQIRQSMHTRLLGHEHNLMACWPLNQIPLTSEAMDAANVDHQLMDIGGKKIAKFRHLTEVDGDSPFSPPELSCVEYSTIARTGTSGARTSMMRRGFVYPSPSGIQIIPDKRVEELELLWVGNSQFAPTLLGYIEGAPPTPGENLTESADYNGATSVTLSTSDDIAYSWNRSDDAGVGADIKVFAGTAGGTYAGLGVEESVEKHRAGFKGNLKLDYGMLNSSKISSKSAIKTKDSLSLRGAQESIAEFPQLGKRFVPKNIGYALVVSALADVFISRLRRSRKMIGYQIVPVEDVPPDINTITFLLNPAYTMAGSLDGLIGNSSASERFYEHVPAMRAQYGSQYPASFYRLSEAYDLKAQIDTQDKNRAAYFANFNSRLVDTASLSREADKGAEPGVVGVHRVVNKTPNKKLSKEESDAADKEHAADLEAAGKANVERQSEAVAEKRKKIDAQLADNDKREHAQAKLASWQKKMEDIQIRAGKRNIVNNYVWDADGGMRSESQSFANVAEHTIGGNFSYNAAGGGEGKFQAGVEVELTAQATGRLTQTMAKTESHSRGFSLDVDLSGLESRGITDHDDYPLMPGVKVDRYRFMSFYLEGSTRNFNDFFDYVVDPEWLISNDEEARALRQAKGKANKTWRVMHRVTYVERPALMGFGRDLRELKVEDEVPDGKKLMSEIDELKGKNQEMQDKLDQILAAIEGSGDKNE